ncbi:MAG: helix-turn-helix domain-containing protein [Firmicutes bacterium]|nr:helix-turn-helix domain-containing protein [Bacillota bacterium]
MKRFKLRSRYFSTFISYVLFIVLPLTVLCGIYLSISLKNIEQNYQKDALKEIQKISNSGENLLNSLETISMQLSVMPLTIKIVKTPYDAGKYDYVQLRDQLQEFLLFDQLYHSIYVYVRISDKIITSKEGIYDLEEFYDKAIVKKAVQDGLRKKWHTTRVLKDPSESIVQDNIITLTTTLPLHDIDMYGALFINIREEKFFDILARYAGDKSADVFVINNEGRIISHGNKQWLNTALEDKYFSIDMLPGPSGVKRMKVGALEYYITYTKSDDVDWTYVSLRPVTEVAQAMKKERLIVLFIFNLVLLLGIIASYLMSKKMFLPWNKLLQKIGAELQNLSGTQEEHDEYRIMDQALDNLISSHKDMQMLVEKNKPIIKEKLITDILMSNIRDWEFLNEKLSYAGVRLDEPFFIALVIDINRDRIKDDENINEGDRLYIRNVVEQEFLGDCSIYGVLLTEAKLAFLINIGERTAQENLQEELTGRCNTIGKHVKGALGITLCFSFGPVCDGLVHVGKSFVEARKALNLKAFMRDNDVIFCDVSHDQLHYPILLHKKIISGIRSMDEEGVREAVDNIFKEYILHKKYLVNEVQQMVTLLISGIINEVWQEDGEFPPFDKINIYNNIQACSNAAMLKNLMKDYFVNMIGKKTKKRELIEKSYYIQKVVKYVEQNYNRCMAVTEIAEYAGLSSSYLSRMFKETTGQTLVEYLTRYRIKQAIKMFSDPKRSIQEISDMVGYGNVHSFIKAFKKYEGLTPGEYRQTM